MARPDVLPVLKANRLAAGAFADAGAEEAVGMPLVARKVTRTSTRRVSPLYADVDSFISIITAINRSAQTVTATGPPCDAGAVSIQTANPVVNSPITTAAASATANGSSVAVIAAVAVQDHVTVRNA